MFLFVSIQISINLGKKFLRISCIRKIAVNRILAKVFAYLLSFISQILDLIYRTVLIFILIYFEWRDTENQQLFKLITMSNLKSLFFKKEKLRNWGIFKTNLLWTLSSTFRKVPGFEISNCSLQTDMWAVCSTLPFTEARTECTEWGYYIKALRTGMHCGRTSLSRNFSIREKPVTQTVPQESKGTLSFKIYFWRNIFVDGCIMTRLVLCG